MSQVGKALRRQQDGLDAVSMNDSSNCQLCVFKWVLKSLQELLLQVSLCRQVTEHTRLKCSQSWLSMCSWLFAGLFGHITHRSTVMIFKLSFEYIQLYLQQTSSLRVWLCLWLQNGITDACSIADCCPLLTICPRCCPRHAPDVVPDMPQMMLLSTVDFMPVACRWRCHWNI